MNLIGFGCGLVLVLSAWIFSILSYSYVFSSFSNWWLIPYGVPVTGMKDAVPFVFMLFVVRTFLPELSTDEDDWKQAKSFFVKTVFKPWLFYSVGFVLWRFTS